CAVAHLDDIVWSHLARKLARGSRKLLLDVVARDERIRFEGPRPLWTSTKVHRRNVRRTPDLRTLNEGVARVTREASPLCVRVFPRVVLASLFMGSWSVLSVGRKLDTQEHHTHRKCELDPTPVATASPERDSDPFPMPTGCIA